MKYTRVCNMKRVILTGPTGVVGMALLHTFLKHDIEVAAVCRPDSKRIRRIPASQKIKVVECGLKEIKDLPQKLTGKYDVFYHLAWEGTIGKGRNDVYEQMHNVFYTIDAVEAAQRAGCTRFVGAGSQAEYGRYEGKLNCDTPAFPENGYGIAKLCAGQMSRLRCSQLGMEHIWARILSVYGPYDGEQTMVMSLLRQLLAGGTPSCTKGEQIWDYIYSKDAAQALYLLGEKGRSASIYCIGSGIARPLAHYMNILRDTVDPKLKLGFGDLAYVPGQVMFLCADTDKLKQDTGFELRYSFEEGAAETVKWLKKQK